MRKVLFLAVALALPAAAAASDADCLISFSGAQQNVCDGTVSSTAPSLQALLASATVADSSLRIVKFGGPINRAQRDAVEAAGARIIDYAPHYAYIVRMPAKLDAAVRRIEGVTWAGPMLPALKVDANIFQELKSGGIIEGLGVEQLSIRLDTEASKTAVRASIASIPGLSVANVSSVGGEMRVQARFRQDQLSSAVEELAMLDEVLSIGFRKPARLANSQGHWLHQSGVNTPEPKMPVWDQGIYGCGQIVGELDTGLWLDHVSFKDPAQMPPIDVCRNGDECPVIELPNYLHRKVVAYYKWSDLSGTSWGDDHGHGTHVAGSIAGNDNVANPGTDCTNLTTPGGDTDLDGMAPGAKLVMQESGSNLAYLNTHGGNSYHAGAVAYANGARIHSNSWGAGCVGFFGCVANCTMTYDQEARDADSVMADNDDLLMVFAAGNDGTDCPNGNNIGSPANAKSVLAIGGNGRGVSGNNTYTSSSRGPTIDSRTKPDLTAQAVGIRSASRSDNGVLAMSGTSMATPTAAGLAALVREYLARGFYPGGQEGSGEAITEPSGALIKAILTAGAFTMTGSGVGPNPGQAQGFGRILLDDSLYFDGDPSRLFIQDAEEGLETGDVDEYALDVQAGQRLSVVLTWTDTPGAVGANPATVNSLRLEVEAPNGDVWTQKLPAGYNVNNANPTQDTSDSNHDNLNNLHRIQFEAPDAGGYMIRVRGINVPSGPQKYALAATGSLEVSVEPTFRLAALPTETAVCAGDPASYDITVRGTYGFDDPVTLSVSGLPGSSTGSFDLNPVVPEDPAAISTLAIGNTAGLARGSYSFMVEGVSAGSEPVTRSITPTLKVSVGVPSSPVPGLPANGAEGTVTLPQFSWSEDVAAESYTIQVATDSGFADIVASGTTSDTVWSPPAALSPLTTYYWRVRADSTCGDSGWSQVRSFTTGQMFPEPYCAVNFPSGVEAITRVKLSGIDNRSPADSSAPHEDFLGVPGGVVLAGEDHEIVVEGDTGGNFTTRVNAFIDWNRNGTFDSGEGVAIGSITNSTGEDGKQAIGTITVPEGVAAGPVRMRVLKKYNSEAAACNGDGYGQAEDYTLQVQPLVQSYSIGGNVSGLGRGIIRLALNNGPDLVRGNGSYVFPELIEDGGSYEVVVTSASGYECEVSNASGTVDGADITDVDVACTISAPDDDLIFANGFEAGGSD